MSKGKLVVLILNCFFLLKTESCLYCLRRCMCAPNMLACIFACVLTLVFRLECLAVFINVRLYIRKSDYHPPGHAPLFLYQRLSSDRRAEPSLWSGSITQCSPQQCESTTFLPMRWMHSPTPLYLVGPKFQSFHVSMLRLLKSFTLLFKGYLGHRPSVL